MALFKKDEAKKVELSDAAVLELKRFMEEEDPEVRKQLADNIKAIRQAEIAEAAAKEKKTWLSKVNPNVVLTGLFGTGQILLILKGEQLGEMLNGRAASFITKLRNPS